MGLERLCWFSFFSRLFGWGQSYSNFLASTVFPQLRKKALLELIRATMWGLWGPGLLRLQNIAYIVLGISKRSQNEKGSYSGI